MLTGLPPHEQEQFLVEEGLIHDEAAEHDHRVRLLAVVLPRDLPHPKGRTAHHEQSHEDHAEAYRLVREQLTRFAAGVPLVERLEERALSLAASALAATAAQRSLCVSVLSLVQKTAHDDFGKMGQRTGRTKFRRTEL